MYLVFVLSTYAVVAALGFGIGFRLGYLVVSRRWLTAEAKELRTRFFITTLSMGCLVTVLGIRLAGIRSVPESSVAHALAGVVIAFALAKYGERTAHRVY